MKRVLVIAAVGEAVTGAALLVVPSLVVELLLGEALTGTATAVARVAGISLIALAAACWRNSPSLGILTYSTVVALYLAYLGLGDVLTGVLLWPAVAFHAVLSALLGRAWLATKERQPVFPKPRPHSPLV
jgi:hypothetical protein